MDQRQARLGKSLAQMGLVKHGRPDRVNGVFYELPEVGVLQAAFARPIGIGGYYVFEYSLFTRRSF